MVTGNILEEIILMSFIAIAMGLLVSLSYNLGFRKGYDIGLNRSLRRMKRILHID